MEYPQVNECDPPGFADDFRNEFDLDWLNQMTDREKLDIFTDPSKFRKTFNYCNGEKFTREQRVAFRDFIYRMTKIKFDDPNSYDKKKINRFLVSARGCFWNQWYYGYIDFPGAETHNKDPDVQLRIAVRRKAYKNGGTGQSNQSAAAVVDDGQETPQMGGWKDDFEGRASTYADRAIEAIPQIGGWKDGLEGVAPSTHADRVKASKPKSSQQMG